MITAPQFPVTSQLGLGLLGRGPQNGMFRDQQVCYKCSKCLIIDVRGSGLALGHMQR